MKKWFTEGDARSAERILGEALVFIEENSVESVAMVESIIGCPHEEGIDYAEGKYRPRCPFWKNRDRFTHGILH